MFPQRQRHVTLKEAKHTVHAAISPASHGSTLWDTALIWIWQRPESILRISKNLQPQIFDGKKKKGGTYLFLIAAICLVHFSSDTP